MLSRILRNRWDVGLIERLFLAARWLLTPYGQIQSAVPRSGRVLDFGCGHGLLSLHLAETSSQRSVIGLDHDARRIAAAQRAGSDVANVRFMGSYSARDWQTPCQCVIFMDMLHYLTFEEQRSLLKQACDSLTPDGVLLVREVERARGLRYAINYVYEWLATHLKFTKSSQEVLYVRSREDWLELLESLGLQATARRVSFPLFSDVLFTARTAGSEKHALRPPKCLKPRQTDQDYV